MRTRREGEPLHVLFGLNESNPIAVHIRSRGKPLDKITPKRSSSDFVLSVVELPLTRDDEDIQI